LFQPGQVIGERVGVDPGGVLDVFTRLRPRVSVDRGVVRMAANYYKRVAKGGPRASPSRRRRLGSAVERLAPQHAPTPPQDEQALKLAHRLHSPAHTPLRDAGFALLPHLPAEWASEAVFGLLFTLFLAWSASPFWAAPRSTPFHSVTLYARTLTAVSVCQALRCAAFLATGLPGPAPHCRAGASTATRPPARAVWEHALVNVTRQVRHGCGDLIFSSHTTFALCGVLAFTYHAAPSPCRRLQLGGVWTAVAFLSLLIIASRKHYTVDVLVAWWTVPLVWCALDRRWSRAREQQQEGEGRAGGRPTCPTCGE
jgi:hypothetical protein